MQFAHLRCEVGRPDSLSTDAFLRLLHAASLRLRAVAFSAELVAQPGSLAPLLLALTLELRVLAHPHTVLPLAQLLALVRSAGLPRTLR